jgi:hypothetical protein
LFGSLNYAYEILKNARKMQWRLGEYQELNGKANI